MNPEKKRKGNTKERPANRCHVERGHIGSQNQKIKKFRCKRGINNKYSVDLLMGTPIISDKGGVLLLSPPFQ